MLNYIMSNFTKFQGYVPDLKNPQTFSEKLQYIKLHGNLQRLSNYVDKYNVRDYVKKTIGQEYLIPMVGIYETIEQIDFNQLPSSFIMKATHGSGWNIIVKDKNKVDWNSICIQMRSWLDSNYGDMTGELCYKPLQGRVIVEELIYDPSGDLKDYKFFCFGGVPHFIQVDSGRFDNHKRNLYDTHWNKLPLVLLYENISETVSMPKNFDKMLSLAAQLSKPFGFVRVDLYEANNVVYFGELTFVPGNGFEAFNPRQFDHQFGELLDLKTYLSDITNIGGALLEN
ncbi:ATP-grasp fold amidoligase family protein [Paenibacillus gansuensis]|uniref:ATP-grasp fold amidoligase family protein n=1 Tax=Paenibacillus gansuensis TaxID=306542 RepID=A0ABW5PIY1_9BACL